MSTMAFSTLRSEVASQLRLNTSEANHATLINRWINLAQDDIWSRYDWPWALEREIVQTVADKTAGTVSINSGATAVTGSSTSFASGDVNKYIQFSSSNDWYRISAFTSATSITIESAYTATTNLSGGTYTIRRFFYNVSANVEKILSVRQTISPAKLELIHFRKLDYFRPHQTATGNPIRYVIWGYDSSDRWQFSLDPWPSTVMNLEVRYKKKATDLSADSDTSEIPEKWKTVLLDGALYHGFEYVRMQPFDANDRRAEIKRNAFEDGISRMMQDADPEGDWHPQIRNGDVSLGIQHVLSLPSRYER